MMASLKKLADALNHTASLPFGYLRKLPLGPSLSAVAHAYRLVGWGMINRVASVCHFPVGPGSRLCEEANHCLAAPLQQEINIVNSLMQRYARGVMQRLCRAGASAAIVGLVAAIDSQATNYNSVTTECITMSSAINDWLADDPDGQKVTFSGGCAEGLHDVGVQCAHSLFQAAHLSAGAFWDFLRYVDLPGLDQKWAYVHIWGSDRVAILSGLLQDVAGGGSSPAAAGVAARPLRMAEVGVFQANTSRALLERFPKLHMLLVDPYHLSDEHHDKEFQQLQEFYVSSRDIFDVAGAWTQPYRDRATFVVQGSVEAASWVTPGSLDLVFIDGDHRFSSVKRDILAWWPTVRPGGVIAGHDFAFTFPGVVEAVTKFALSNDLALFVSPEVWWFVRPQWEAALTPDASAAADASKWEPLPGVVEASFFPSAASEEPASQDPDAVSSSTPSRGLGRISLDSTFLSPSVGGRSPGSAVGGESDSNILSAEDLVALLESRGYRTAKEGACLFNQ